MPGQRRIDVEKKQLSDSSTEFTNTGTGQRSEWTFQSHEADAAGNSNHVGSGGRGVAL